MIGQAPRGKSVRENAAMQILPSIDDYFANDLPFKGSLPEHVKRILPEIRRSQAVLKSGPQLDVTVQSNFSFSKCAKRDSERKRNKALKGVTKVEDRHMSYLSFMGIEDKSNSISCSKDHPKTITNPNQPRFLCCTFCSYSETNKNNMILHLKAHTADNPMHQCSLCRQSPCYKERQYRHIDNWLVNHMEGMFQFIQPDPVTRSDLQCPLYRRLSNSNNITTYEFYTYSELVEQISVHIGGHSLLCDLCASNQRTSSERVPNNIIQAMKQLIFKHRTNEMVQSVTSEWYPGKSLEPHHIELIKKLFVDCG